MLGIRPERKGIQVEASSLLIQSLESMSNPNIHPNSHVIGSDIKSSMVKLDRLLSSSQVGKSGSNFVHQKIVGWVKVQSPVEEINRNLVLSLDEEQYRTG